MAMGSRNGTQPKPIQTAEGEISVAMPQVRGTAEHVVSRVITDTKAVRRTRLLEAPIIGSYVRAGSDIESLAQKAGLGVISARASPARAVRDTMAICSRSPGGAVEGGAV